MKPSFLKFAIALCVLSFATNFILPVVLIVTNKWNTDWSWIPFLGNIPLLFCFVYVSYRFYYSKNVRVIFFLELIQLLVAIVSLYPALLRKMANQPADYNVWTTYVIYGMGVIIAVAMLLSPLRKERWLLVFAIGILLIRVTQVTGMVLHSLPLLSFLHMIALIFQLIWIPIYYSELRKLRFEGQLDHVIDR